MSESGGTAVSSAIGALTRNLRSRAFLRDERKLFRARLARIAHRWSRDDLEHIEGASGQRELLLAAVQCISARRLPTDEQLLSARVDGAVAQAIDEVDPVDTEPSRPPALRLVYSSSD
jgi:hypothetical protein